MGNFFKHSFFQTLLKKMGFSKEWFNFRKLLLLALGILGVCILVFSFSGISVGSAEMSHVRDQTVSFFGLFVLMAIAFALSNNRDAINLRLVAMGLLIQFVFAVIVLKTDFGRGFFQVTSDVITSLLAFTNKGSEFLFGTKLMDVQNFGFIFAFQVLPTIIFVSSLTALLYYFGILQFVVGWMARGMSKLMKISGAESLSTAVNIFVGQTEAPLFIRPYVHRMTNSELMLVMVGGFANLAGAVMAAYAIFLKQAGLHSGAGHLLTSSVISAPASVIIAKIMYPEVEKTVTSSEDRVDVPITDVNALDAATRGASEGLKLAVNVAAMLLAFIALMAMFNWMFGAGLDQLFTSVGLSPLGLSIEKILGWIFSPLAWVMGVPWADCMKIGHLLGEKTILNEFVAYLDLASLIKSGAISERAQIIAVYALCGFSNFSSIAIQIGGIGVIAPSRRGDLAKLGLRAMIGGSLATFMTATIAGILL